MESSGIKAKSCGKIILIVKCRGFIFFDWKQDGISNHVGIVEKVENGTVYTIEGNSENECRGK